MKRFWFTGNLPFTRVGNLSGGERRRLQLLAVLARQPNVLLLDEPTNDLDLDTLRILEDFLDDWPGTLIVVSHDRAFLDRTIETVVAVGPDGVAPVPGGLDAWIAGAGRHCPIHPSGAGGSIPGPGPGPGPVGRPTCRPVAAGGREGDDPTRSSAGQAPRGAAVDRRPRRLTRLGVELRSVQDELDVAEEQWLALAEQADRRT